MEKKLYLSLNTFLKEKFGERVKKIPLDAGFTCPNRDGTKGVRGCLYCDARGSGTGLIKQMNLKEQLDLFLSRFKRKGYQKFIAYFQSFSNTYGPVEKLRKTYGVIFDYPEIVGLAIGTRPDCIDKAIVELLKEFQERGYFLWIELGLQSRHNETLKRLNRGHSFEDFLKAYSLLREAQIPTVVHLIFGLPWETKEMMLETAQTLAELKPSGVKFHALYLVKGTPLAEIYEKERFPVLSLEEYAELVGEALARLSPETVIHRLTSDPPREELIAPLWLLNKNEVLNQIQAYLKSKGLYQGKLYQTLS